MLYYAPDSHELELESPSYILLHVSAWLMVFVVVVVVACLILNYIREMDQTQDVSKRLLRLSVNQGSRQEVCLTNQVSVHFLSETRLTTLRVVYLDSVEKDPKSLFSVCYLRINDRLLRVKVDPKTLQFSPIDHLRFFHKTMVDLLSRTPREAKKKKQKIR
jgi:hypothetical protein